MARSKVEREFKCKKCGGLGTDFDYSDMQVPLICAKCLESEYRFELSPSRGSAVHVSTSNGHRMHKGKNWSHG